MLNMLGKNTSQMLAKTEAYLRKPCKSVCAYVTFLFPYSLHASMRYACFMLAAIQTMELKQQLEILYGLEKCHNLSCFLLAMHPLLFSCKRVAGEVTLKYL